MPPSILALAFALSGPLVVSHSRGPALIVDPSIALVDEPVRVVARGLEPGTEAMITATLVIESGEVLRAEASFAADEDGVVDVARAPSRSGTYTGIDPMGLFWSMTPAEPGPPRPPGPPCAPPEPCRVTLELRVGGAVVGDTVAERRFLADGVRTVDVREQGVVGRLFLPPEGHAPPPVVIVLSGSEGGIPDVRAALLASHGFAALALAYFGAEGLPDELFEIPVETVERGIAWLQDRDDVASERIAVLGGSKGAELALLAASYLPEIDAVVAYAPSAFVWPGISRSGGSRDESSWTWRGEPVAYVRHVASPEFEAQFRGPPPYRLRLLYEPSIADTVAAARGAIAVERIAGPLLLVAGDDDQMGSSCENAEEIASRLEQHGRRSDATVLCYERAGHAIGFPYVPTTTRVRAGPFALGGQPAAYARADRESWSRVLAFLRETLLGRQESNLQPPR